MKAGREVVLFLEPRFILDRITVQSKSRRSWTQVLWRGQVKWHWMLQFYIVWQRCLLDMPYHKYHLLLLVSGLPDPVRSRLKFISKELRGGLSFTAEAWQRERAATEPSQSRPGKITPKFQWHNGQNQSGSLQTIRSAQRDERRRAAAERSHTVIIS